MMKKKKYNTPVIMLMVMALNIILTALSAYIYTQTAHKSALYVCIIFGAAAAHFLVMFFSAPMVFMIFGKKFKYDSFWFQPKKFEKKLYQILKVKKWKTKVITYNSEEYSLKTHTAEEVIMNMCHAEAAHEVIIVTSYLPVLGGFFISHWGLLVLTSFIFSCCHLVFVIIQRYNRPRVVRLYEAS